MSDAWAMNAGKAATAVGTATIEADDELFTIVGHGLGVGDTVVVDTLTGGAAGVLDEGQVYWVVDVTTDTFAVSQHRNGAPVAFSTDGGADVYRFAPQFSAVELRRLDSGLLTNDSGDRFGAREGIHPGTDPAISVSGTTWTVENVAGVVYPALSSTSGPYRFAHPSESGSLDPADGTNDRIDALDLQIQDDDEDASGQRRARVVYTAGTPAASPSAPAQAGNSLRLGTILVPSGGTPSPSVSTDAQAPFTVAAGGVIPVRDDTEGPSSGQYEGMVRYNRDTDSLEVWDGSAWTPIARAAGWTYIGGRVSTSGSSVDVDITDGGRFPVGTFDIVRLHARYDLDAEGYVGCRINGSTSTVYRYGDLVWDAATGALDDVVHAAGSSLWHIGHGATVSTNNLICEIMLAGGSDLQTYQSTSNRQSDSSTTHRWAVHWGALDAAIGAVSFLRILPVAGATNFSSLIYWVEGYRTP